MVEQHRLAGLALEHLQGSRRQPHQQRRSTGGRKPGTNREPQLNQAGAHPVALVLVFDRIGLLEQLPKAVEVVGEEQSLGVARQLAGRYGGVVGH
jgi:hypothetical protein